MNILLIGFLLFFGLPFIVAVIDGLYVGTKDLINNINEEIRKTES